jgi:hypothetical protein
VETAKEYGRAFGLWVVFVIRLYELQQAGDERYPLPMTDEQKRSVERAIRYCDKDPSRPRANRILADLARWFWRPEDPEYFSHMAQDQFNDPTVRFAALTNLREDGSFALAGNATHNMVRIKYFMRDSLVMWSKLEVEENDAQVSG